MTLKDKLSELTAWLHEQGVSSKFTITLELDALMKLAGENSYFPEHTLVSMRVKTPHGWVVVRGRRELDPLSRADD
jgi:hypothetical protein